MAKFRSSHTSNKPSLFSGTVKLLLAGIILLLLFVFTGPLVNQLFDAAPEMVTQADRFYLPASDETSDIIHHRYFTLAYAEDLEQARWVAYELTRAMLNGPRVERTDWFEEDTMISTGSAHYEDYRGSGYSRGHLVPAADRAFSKAAMEETFLMSNISPQVANFNGGIWRELEENVRDWAREKGRLYIITGPVIKGSEAQEIGDNEVTVPQAFYKVVLSDDGRELTAVGFLIPNQVSDKPLADYSYTVDSIEQITGIDFFPEFLTEEIESTLESQFDLDLWTIDPYRFRRRVEAWNKR